MADMKNKTQNSDLNAYYNDEAGSDSSVFDLDRYFQEDSTENTVPDKKEIEDIIRNVINSKIAEIAAARTVQMTPPARTPIGSQPTESEFDGYETHSAQHQSPTRLVQTEPYIPTVQPVQSAQSAPIQPPAPPPLDFYQQEEAPNDTKLTLDDYYEQEFNEVVSQPEPVVEPVQQEVMVASDDVKDFEEFSWGDLIEEDSRKMESNQYVSETYYPTAAPQINPPSYPVSPRRFDFDSFESFDTDEQDVENPGQSWAVISMILGIIAVPLYFTVIFGLLGLIFSLIARAKDNRSGQAAAGLVLNIIALILSAVFFAIFFLM